MNVDRDRLNIAFSLVTGPGRKGWPTHGAFGQSGGGTDGSTSPPIFSVALGREVIKGLVDKDVITGDQAGELENQVIASGLPADKTRWDKIVELFTGRRGMAPRLIGALSGASALEEGSGPARFEACQDGHLCRSDSCGHYPAHGRIALTGLNVEFGTLIFSEARAKQLVDEGLKLGYFDADESAQVILEAGHMKLALEAGRFDALASGGLDPQLLNAMLDIVVGLVPIEKPAELVSCHSHVHITGVNEVTFGGRLYTTAEATKAIDNHLKIGLIDDTDALRLRERLTTLGLPETAPEGDDEIPLELREMIDVIFDGQVPQELQELLRGGRVQMIDLG